jgi:chromosome segregation ATPase
VTTNASTTQIEELEAKAEEIAQEVESLDAQLRDAQSQIARAQARFNQLEAERKILAPRTFAGDSKAKVELEALEDEHEELARATRVARAAEPELARMLEEARARLRQANVATLKAEADALNREMHALDPERDALADQLDQILERQNNLYGEMVNTVREYNGDQANTMTLNQDMYGRWIRERFRRWL